MSAALAGAAAALTVWLAAGPLGRSSARRLLDLRPGPASVRIPVHFAAGRRVQAVAAAAVAGAVGTALGPGAVLPFAVVAGEATRRLLAAREQRAAAAVRDAMPELYAALAAELRAGRPPALALGTAAVTAPEPLAGVVAPVVSAAMLGGDVAAGLRAAAVHPGAVNLTALAACWSVADDVGAGLAAAVQRLTEAQRDRARHRADVDAQLAGVRATARLLAGLPLIGLLLGAALGADPAGFLLHHPAGAVCAVGACLLDVAGLHWTDRIARRAVEAL